MVRTCAAAADFTAWQSIDARFFEKLFAAQPRLGDDIHRTIFERFAERSARPPRPGWNRSPPESDAGS